MIGKEAFPLKKRTALLCALAAAAVPAALVAPGRADEKKKEPFQNRNFAHRGLHAEDKSVPENSLEAFRLACEAGYGMELDVQLSRDGRVVVFHDDTLNRVCGVDARVDELDFDELRALRLCGTDHQIPLFSEVLDVVHGRGPLIVELKSGRRNRELCEKTLLLLRGYGGDYCIESFDPTIVGWFRKNAPDILRGQLASPPRSFWKHGVHALRSIAMGNTLMNAVSRPQFIAYRIGPRPPLVRLSEAMGAMRIGWTAHDASAEQGRDAVIFEFYRPEPFYR